MLPLVRQRRIPARQRRIEVAAAAAGLEVYDQRPNRLARNLDGEREAGRSGRSGMPLSTSVLTASMCARRYPGARRLPRVARSTMCRAIRVVATDHRWQQRLHGGCTGHFLRATSAADRGGGTSRSAAIFSA